MTPSLRLSSRSLARQRLIDSLCLAFCVAVLAAPFVSALGFYSDDWSLLADFQRDLVNNRFGIDTMLRGFEARPFQGIYLASLFYAFGLDPLGYHIVNAIVRAAAMISFYWLLLRIRIDRSIAFAAAAILIIVPQRSTSRVWFSTFQIPLSMLLALLSLHAQMSFAKTGAKAWLMAAVAFAVASIAAYEIFAPIIVGFSIWLLIEAWRSAPAGRRPGRQVALAAAAIFAVALTVIAKGWLTDRAQAPDLRMYMKGLLRLLKPDYDWRTEGSLNIFATLDVNLWQPLVGLWKGGSAALHGELGAFAVLAGVAVAAVTLWRLTTAEEGGGPGGSAIRAIVVGITAFVLAHATFLISSQIMFSPTGIGNRALVGMALGIALGAAGLVALAASTLSVAAARWAFACVLSLVVLAGSWRTEQISRYWAETWSIEQELIASARRDLATIPARSMIMFDGVCPYHGPGIVMETWEAGGMLTLALGREIVADTSSDRMKVGPRGLVTSIYGDDFLYPYGPNLYVYDPTRHVVAPLPDRAAAIAYFTGSETRSRCPEGFVGQGELI